MTVKNIIPQLKIFLQNVLNNKEFYSKNSHRVYKDYFDPKIIRLKLGIL